MVALFRRRWSPATGRCRESVNGVPSRPQRVARADPAAHHVRAPVFRGQVARVLDAPGGGLDRLSDAAFGFLAVERPQPSGDRAGHHRIDRRLLPDVAALHALWLVPPAAALLWRIADDPDAGRGDLRLFGARRLFVQLHQIRHPRRRSDAVAGHGVPQLHRARGLVGALFRDQFLPHHRGSDRSVAASRNAGLLGATGDAALSAEPRISCSTRSIRSPRSSC